MFVACGTMNSRRHLCEQRLVEKECLSDLWEKLGPSQRMPVKIIIIMVMMFIVH